MRTRELKKFWQDWRKNPDFSSKTKEMVKCYNTWLLRAFFPQFVDKKKGKYVDTVKYDLKQQKYSYTVLALKRLSHDFNEAINAKDETLAVAIYDEFITTIMGGSGT